MSKSLRVLVTVTALLAVACLYWGNWSFPATQASPFRDALVAFALVGVLSEASYVRLRIGQSATHSSIVFIPFIASILLFESGWTMLIACAVIGFGELFIRQKTPVKVIFNVAQHGMSVWVGATAFRLLGGLPAFSGDAITTVDSALTFPMQFVAIGGGVLAYFLFNISAVSAAVSLNDKTSIRLAWLRIGSSQLVYDLVSSPLGVLLALFYVKMRLVGVFATLVPLFFVRRAYRVTIELEEANRDLLELMVKAIEARDPYTSGHSQRVSRLAELLAKELGLGAKLVEQVRTAALLHDVGKIHEEYAPLLRKEGKLDPAEKALMQTHSMRSADLVGTISAFRGSIVDAVRHHHENYDGTGYPSALAGYAIPVGSRIIMIADTVDAMTTDRPYRKALSFERVASELAKFSGRQFDPHLVDVFMHSVAIRDLINQRVPDGAESGPSVTSWASSLPWRRSARRIGLTPSA
jgi:putative nucleotidyltransferase with HDIG domain